MARVTLQTIADEVGVSRMTVSNAFSRPDQLSQQLRTKILSAADQLGYVGPDPAARALARGTSGSIGIVLTSGSLANAFADEVSTGFLGSVAAAMTTSGTALTLLPTATVQGSIPARDVPMDAALVYSCDATSTAVDWLKRRGLPMVFVDQEPEKGISSINVDDRDGARAAAQHVVDLGHRRVAVMTAALGPSTGLVDEPATSARSDKYVSRERLLGYLEALDAAGISPLVHRQLASDDEEAYAAARLLLEREERPTAMLCFSDVIASGVYRAADDLGLSIPDDLSVVGFDDSPLARRLLPQLTTVRQDVAEKGRLAAAALAVALEHHRADTKGRARHLKLPTELVVRDSTAAPPASDRH